MLNFQQLDELSKIEINQVAREALADIDHVGINPEAPEGQRLENYVAQIGNPYCFRCGDIPVRVRFVSKEKMLAQTIVDYFTSLK